MSTPQELREQADRAEKKALAMVFPASHAIYLREALDNALESYKAWVWSHPEGEADEYVEGRDITRQLCKQADALIRSHPWETLGPDGVKKEIKFWQQRMDAAKRTLRYLDREAEQLQGEAKAEAEDAYDEAAREYKRLLEFLATHEQEVTA